MKRRTSNDGYFSFFTELRGSSFYWKGSRVPYFILYWRGYRANDLLMEKTDLLLKK